jgi:outer membrane lipoprotein-sorting protein
MKITKFLQSSIFLIALSMSMVVPKIAFGQSYKNRFDQVLTQPKFTPSDQTKINKAVAHLEQMRTIQGRFRQTDHKGRMIEGDYYLSRPGKIRFQYDKPNGSIIIADGRWVHKWDERLKTTDRFAQDHTPLSLILKNQIRFDQGVIITKVSSDQKGYELLMRDRRKQVEGQISLRFVGNDNNDNKIQLNSWTVTDAQGRATKVELLGIETKKSFSPSLFVPIK